MGAFPLAGGQPALRRGLGAARTGDLESAEAAVGKLSRLTEKAREAGEDYFAQQIEISRLGVEGALAQANGDAERAVQLMRRAAELEASTEKHPVTPGSVQPAGELYGDLLLSLGRNSEALEAYETSLKTWPRRFNSLLGAARAAAAAGERGTSDRLLLAARRAGWRVVERSSGPEGSEGLPATAHRNDSLSQLTDEEGT